MMSGQPITVSSVDFAKVATTEIALRHGGRCPVTGLIVDCNSQGVNADPCAF